MDVMDKMVEIGYLGKPHGIRGEIALIIKFSGFVPGSKQCSFFLDDMEKLPVSSIRDTGKGKYILGVEGIRDRNGIEKYRGRTVLVHRDFLPEPESGFFTEDLIGFEIRNLSGNILGKITGYIQTAGPDVLEIEGEYGNWMLPAIDPLIVSVDSEGFVTVDPPDGLLPGT